MDHNSRKIKSLSRQDIKEIDLHNWRPILNHFEKNGGDINSSSIESGPEAGYTLLHFACINNRDWTPRVLSFINEYGANVNAVGKDGAQPLHIAATHESRNAIKLLIKFGANVNAEISKELHEKYANDKKWTDNFGGKMPLLAWAIINSQNYLAYHLLWQRCNFAIKDINNKTLLMYAAESNNDSFIVQVVRFLHTQPELINARDNKGLHVVHYIIPNKDFSLDNEILIQSMNDIAAALIKSGANMNATVNGDPDTLLLNKAVYRLCWSLVEILLDFRVPLSKKSQPLRYLTHLVEDPTKRLQPFCKFEYITDVWCRKEAEQKCLECILKNFVIRRSCGWFVPENEIKLMDQLTATYSPIRKFVSDCEKNLVTILLKNRQVHYGDKFISLHEIVKKANHNSSLKLLIQNNTFVEAFRKFSAQGNSFDKEIKTLVWETNFQIQEAFRRRNLLEQNKKMENLMKAIPLPYEIILNIINFIENDSLKDFIDAFDDAHFNDDGSYSENYWYVYANDYNVYNDYVDSDESDTDNDELFREL